MRRLDLRDVLREVAEEDHDAERRVELERAVPWIEFLAEVVKGSPGRWARDAACGGMTELFFPERGQPARVAYDLCHMCTVRAECAAWAAEHGTEGIAAGETARGRRRRLSEVASDGSAEQVVA